MRNRLTFFKLSAIHLLKRFVVDAVVLAIRIRKPKIAFTYCGDYQQDGAGAQLQRIIAIYSLSKSLNIGYLHSRIQEVSVHPLDSHQTINEYHQFLTRLNDFANLPSDIDLSEGTPLISEVIVKLKLRNLFRFVFTPSSRQQVIGLVDIYSVIDCKPSMYRFAKEAFKSKIAEFSIKFEKEQIQDVAVHYRSVPGDFSVYSGERISRQLTLERLENAIRKATKSKEYLNSRIVIFTDAPSKDLVIPVFATQKDQWEGTPAYANGSLTLHGRDVRSVVQRITSNFDIVIGGDPLEALVFMAKAPLLIISKSSLSYVAFLISEKKLTFSPWEFWHPTPKSRKY